jgi:outer membrane cobalamin receptor
VARLGGELRQKEIRADVLTPPSTDVQEAGLWAQVELDRAVREGSIARLILGLRADRHDLLDGVQFSPGLSTSLETRGARIELAYRNAFAPPGLADLFFQEGVLVRPNPDLKPERVRGEIAATVDTRIRVGPSRIRARLSTYRTDIDDMILWLPDFQFTWSPSNLDVSRSGFELGSTVELPVLGREHRFSVQAAWNHVEYRGGVLHGQVAYRPVFSGNAEARVNLSFGYLTLSGNHIGTRRSVPGSDLNSLPPYTLVDLGWSSTVNTGWVSGRIEFALSNLLDERAALLVDYPLPSRGWCIRLRLAPANRR